MPRAGDAIAYNALASNATWNAKVLAVRPGGKLDLEIAHGLAGVDGLILTRIAWSGDPQESRPGVARPRREAP